MAATQDIAGTSLKQDSLTGSSGTGLNPNTVHSGEGTYYYPNGLGNCGFELNGNTMYAALSTADYANAGACGSFIEVTGPKGKVNVQVVDSCPPCKPGDVDLSEQAFSQIADLSAGRVPITWRLLSPGGSQTGGSQTGGSQAANSETGSVFNGNPISYYFKEGTNPYYTAIQVRNSRNPIASVEYQASDGSFKPLERTDFNYFVSYQGLGSAPLTLEVTDIYGNEIVDGGIAPIAGSTSTSDEQFPVV
jgi:expansin (peptidoglycan-binding protein)